MALIASISIDVKKIDKDKLVKGQYLNLDVAVRDETNQYGQNVSLYVSQSKEERESKVAKTYLGNGRVVWTDGKAVVGVKQSNQELVDF